jgi:tRNA A-37 threonylcarbamoyl transferase component Bud32
MRKSGLGGESLGPYQLLEQVGAGGMATVYRAVDSRSGAERALKVLSPAIGDDEQFVRRFRREGKLLARLKHPNIIPVLDYGETDKTFYLVMPFIQGETLQRKLVHRRFSEAEIRRWIRQVAGALEFAHQRGVIHRDVKPSNILVDKIGNAYLMDFGLARLSESSGSLTGSLLLGTPAYVSPEQARSERLDARTDQYSMGVILFQLVTGRLPFETDTPMATVMKHMREPPPQPRSLNPELPPAAEKVILKCLAKMPGDRFSSVGEAARTFEAALDGASVTELGLDQEPTPGPTTGARLRAMVWRNRPAALLALAVIPLLLVGGLILVPALSGRQEGAQTAAPARTPVATPGSFQKASFDCPDISLIGAFVGARDIAWTIVNGTDDAIRLFGMGELLVPEPGPIGIELGGETIWEGEPGSGALFWTEGADRWIAARSTERLALVYNSRPPRTGYHLELNFDNACDLEGDW